MQLAKKEVKLYPSGFAKEVQRGKYNLKINERLKAARTRKGLSVAGVVRGLKKQGVSIGHSTLIGYEADETNLNHRYPSLPVLTDLADFYGCSLDYLFGLTDRYKPLGVCPKETDLRDLLESRSAVAYNGYKLNKEQREELISKLDSLLAELV